MPQWDVARTAMMGQTANTHIAGSADSGLTGGCKMTKAYNIASYIAFAAGLIAMLNGNISEHEYFFTWAALVFSLRQLVVMSRKMEGRKNGREG